MNIFNQHRDSPNPPAVKAGIASAAVLATSSVALAGLIGPGGGALTWTGSNSSSWHNAANWNTGSIPTTGDAAIVDGGPFTNIFLNGDSADLGSLYIAGTKLVSTNGHLLDVTNSGGATTITGIDSRLFVTSNGGGSSFRTDELEILGTSRLQMSGGIARIYDQLTMNGDSRITGYGLVEVYSANAVAFNAFDAQQISASGGDLTLRVHDGGGFAMPPLINILNDNSTLSIEGPFFIDDFDDINMGTNTVLNVDESWDLLGTLNADPGDGNTATVTGGAVNVEGVLDVDSGTLVFESQIGLDSSATISIGPGDALEINGAHNVNSGQVANVALNGVLRVNGIQGFFPWYGDVNLTAATLEVNEPQITSWNIEGDIAMGNIAGARPSLAGTAPMRAFGDITLNGLGGNIDNDLDLRAGASMHITLPGTHAIVNGSLNQRTGAHIFGNGFIQIAETGSMAVHEPVNIDVSVVNGGSFEVVGDGEEPGYVYIDGEYTQEATGVLPVQIAGPTSLERDVFETNGAVTLAGDISVELLGGYVPNLGDTFVVFTGNGGLFGAFDNVTGEPGFEVSYDGNDVVLTYVGLGTCPTDINGDGVSDTADLGLLIAAFGTMNAGADINNDGIVDTADLGILISQFGMPCL